MTAKCNKGSVDLLSHFHKVLALSKFALLKCEIEVNPVAWIPHCAISICVVLVAQGNRATGFTSFSHLKSANFESANTLSKYESKATLP